MVMELPIDGDVKNWRIPDVVNWLHQNRMEVYVDDFRDNYIDGEGLLSFNDGRLRQLNVHPTHIKQMLKAIKYYRDHNPDNDYEYASDPDDFGDDDDDDDDGQDSSSYTAPDEIEEMHQQAASFRQPQPPDDPEEPDESYEEPGAHIVPPPRPQKTTAATRKPAPPAKQQQVEPTPAPAAGRPFRAVPTPPVSTSGHLTSLPDTQAPVPPLPNTTQKHTRGSRPAAPLPSAHQPPPVTAHRYNEHISTEPKVPLHESLEEEQINYEVVEEAQLDYEVVDQVEPSSNNSSLGRPTVRGGPLPRTPSDDEEGSGGSVSSTHFRAPMNVPRGGGTGRTQYPLVTLPNNTQGSSNTTGKKKVIQSYTVHDLPPCVTASASPSGGSNNTPPFSKPLPMRPNNTASSNTQFPAKSPTTRQQPLLPPTPQLPQPPDDSSEDFPVSQDTTGMSVKERMALLRVKGDSGQLKPPIAGSKPANIMEEMRRKQNDRKRSDGVSSSPSRDMMTNSRTGPQTIGQKSTSAPAKPAAPSKAVAAPRTNTAGRPPVDTGPPPLPATSHPSISVLPTTHFNGGVPPALPGSSRPSRESNDAGCAKLTANDDRSMYSYKWYGYDIDRSQSMAILKQRQGERGAFIVRKSNRESNKPYTLDVLYEDHDFHIPLRKRDDGHFAMGTPQAVEDHWASVPQLIDYFRSHSLALTRKVNGVTIKKSTLLID